MNRGERSVRSALISFSYQAICSLTLFYHVHLQGNSQNDEMIPWLARVSKNSTCFTDPIVNFTVIHFKRKVMKIVFDGTEFEIKKNLLKYGKDKKSFYYLGIYFVADEQASYGGLIGENE